AGELDKAQMLATGSALHLVQALAAAPLPRTPRLWLVTRGAQAVGATGVAHPLQAPLWGLGTTLALEHPELQPTRQDLDPTAGPDEQVLTGLLAELWQPTAEEQVAFRDGARYVARLVRRQEQAPAEPSNVTPVR